MAWKDVRKTNRLNMLQKKILKLEKNEKDLKLEIENGKNLELLNAISEKKVNISEKSNILDEYESSLHDL